MALGVSMELCHCHGGVLERIVISSRSLYLAKHLSWAGKGMQQRQVISRLCTDEDSTHCYDNRQDSLNQI